jgi:trimeric autotransporter adhesin
MITTSLRFITEVQDLNGLIKVFDSLKPQAFTLRENNEQWYGFIAEEVEKIAPSLIIKDKEGKPYSIKYEAIIALLVKEIQTSRDSVKKLEHRIEDLEYIMNMKERAYGT